MSATNRAKKLLDLAKSGTLIKETKYINTNTNKCDANVKYQGKCQMIQKWINNIKIPSVSHEELCNGSGKLLLFLNNTYLIILNL